MIHKNDINGYENENSFVYYFNNKKIYELDPISQELISTIYGNLDKNESIRCKLNLNKQKSDIIIIINNIKKYISIKKGYKNSVHTEHIFSFIKFLKECGMSNCLAQKLLLFHYGDGTTNGTGKARFSTKEYILNHPEDIRKLNCFFNNDSFIKKAIERIVIYGINSNVPIDAIIWGMPNDFMWLTKDEIIDICIKHKGISKNGLAISGIFYQPFNRCLNFNSKYEKYRHYVQFKWYHLSDDIIETMAFYRKKW